MPVPTADFTANTQIKSSEIDANFAYLTDMIDTANGAVAVKTTAKARAYLATDQENLTNATATKVQLGTETYDLGSNFDNSSGYDFTCPVAGYYLAIGQVSWKDTDMVADKPYSGSIYKNAAEVAAMQGFTAAADEVFTCPVSTIIKCNANDTISLYAKHGAGNNNQDVNAGSQWTFLEVHLLSTD